MRIFMLRIFVSNMSVIHIQHQTNAFLYRTYELVNLSTGKVDALSLWHSDLLRKTKTKLVTWFQKIR